MFVRSATVKVRAKPSCSALSTHDTKWRRSSSQSKRRSNVPTSVISLNKLRSGRYVVHRKKIQFLVRGRRFETFESTLSNFPDTLLGNASKRQAYFDTHSGTYKLDRCVHSFDSILFYYQSNGILAKPSSVPREVFYQELSFYNLAKIMDERHKEDVTFLAKRMNDISILPRSKAKLFIWKMLRFYNDTWIGRVYTFLNILVTLVSVIAYCMETIPELCSFKTWIIIEMGVTMFFFLELLLAALSSTKIKDLRSLITLLDICSLASSFIYLLFSFRDINHFPFLFVKFSRVIRVFKCSKFSTAFRLFLYTLYKCSKNLQVLLVSTMVACFSYSALTFLFENQFHSHVHGDSKFESILDSFWYTVITATGVGYGDIYPTTPPGKLCGSLIAITGLLLFCLPQPMLVNQFISIYYLQETMSENDSLRKRAIMKMRETLLEDA